MKQAQKVRCFHRCQALAAFSAVVGLLGMASQHHAWSAYFKISFETSRPQEAREDPAMSEQVIPPVQDMASTALQTAVHLAMPKVSPAA